VKSGREGDGAREREGAEGGKGCRGRGWGAREGERAWEKEGAVGALKGVRGRAVG